MKLLHVDSSILGTQSATRELGAAVVENWRRRNPDVQVRHRDLVRQPLGHLTGELVMARSADAAEVQDAALRAELDAGAAAIDEFLDADVVVIGAPMYNFSVPTQLKAWIDRIAVAGKTFRYTANGPEGLAGGKKIIVVSARGGVYSTGPAAAFDHQEAYLRSVFGLLGISDIEFVRAEALNMGAERRAEAMAHAHRVIAGEALPLAA
jgi:FMN-dependent NADH-azoreductase